MMTTLSGVFFLLLAVLCGPGEAIMCYQCDNSKTSACGENFKAYQFDAIPCDDTLGANKCGKQKQDPNEDGWVGIIRSCYPIGALPGLNSSNGCHRWFNPYSNFSALYCFCDKDFCNAAPSSITISDPATRLLYVLALLLAVALPSWLSLWPSALLDRLPVDFLAPSTGLAVQGAVRASRRQGLSSRREGCSKAGQERRAKRKSSNSTLLPPPPRECRPSQAGSRGATPEATDADDACLPFHRAFCFQRHGVKSSECGDLVNTSVWAPSPREQNAFRQTLPPPLKDTAPSAPSASTQDAVHRKCAMFASGFEQ